MLSPDGSLVRGDRYEALTREEREGYAPLVPDVVVEIASPSDSIAQQREKCERWKELGAGYVVFLEAFARTGEAWGTLPAHFSIAWCRIFEE